MKLAPIVLFVYNRPVHTKQTIEALAKNDLAIESDLVIYSDAPKDEAAVNGVTEVRTIIKETIGFKSVKIIEREENWGLADSIIDGVTKIINQYGRVIVLEDDLITNQYFLKFMNDCLDLYLKDDRIWSISGYTLPIYNDSVMDNDTYLLMRSWSWGFATWCDRWGTINWDHSYYSKKIKDRRVRKKIIKHVGEDLILMMRKQINGYIDSWYVRWQISQAINDKYCVYSRDGFVDNIGNDGSGSHCGISNKFNKILQSRSVRLVDNPSIDKYIESGMLEFTKPNVLRENILIILRKLGLYVVLKRFFR